jgi:hypothetical protein
LFAVLIGAVALVLAGCAPVVHAHNAGSQLARTSPMEVGLYDVRADRLRLVRDEHGP